MSVAVGGMVAVGVSVGISVCISVGVSDGVSLGVSEGVSVGVPVGVGDGLSMTVTVPYICVQPEGPCSLLTQMKTCVTPGFNALSCGLYEKGGEMDSSTVGSAIE